MTHAAQTRFLHVANGTATTRLIHAAGIPGTLSIWADPLHDGPVPGGLTDDELLEVRARHLGGPSGDPVADEVNDLRNWRSVIARHEAYDELILWFEHDLFDQLNLIQVLSWIAPRVPAATTVSLICIGSFPGRPRFKGLGELSPAELASLLETRRRVSEAQYDLATRAWEAFREPTPEALDELRHRDNAALPYLNAAVERFLQEYPWATDGLSRTERRLLTLAEAGPMDLQAAFPQMHDGEEFYYVADSSLADLAHSFARTSPPLLTFTPGRLDGGGFLQGSVSLAELGRAVLAGRQDRIAILGIDCWLGGVHLQGERDIWRWDAQRRRITRL